MFQCEASDKLGPGLCLATQTYNASSDKTQRFLRKHFLCTRISILRIHHDKLASAKVYCNEKYTCAKNKVKLSNIKRMDKCYKHDDVIRVCKFGNKNIECYHNEPNKKKKTVITH